MNEEKLIKMLKEGILTLEVIKRQRAALMKEESYAINQLERYTIELAEVLKDGN